MCKTWLSMHCVSSVPLIRRWSHVTAFPNDLPTWITSIDLTGNGRSTQTTIHFGAGTPILLPPFPIVQELHDNGCNHKTDAIQHRISPSPTPRKPCITLICKTLCRQRATQMSAPQVAVPSPPLAKAVLPIPFPHPGQKLPHICLTLACRLHGSRPPLSSAHVRVRCYFTPMQSDDKTVVFTSRAYIYGPNV